MREMKSHARLAAAGVALGILAGCVGGPTTKDDLCSAYREYRSEATQPQWLDNTDLFDALRDLGDAAERYEGDSSIQGAGVELKRMGESDSYSPMQAELTAAPIRAECRADDGSQ